MNGLKLMIYKHAPILFIKDIKRRIIHDEEVVYRHPDALEEILSQVSSPNFLRILELLDCNYHFDRFTPNEIKYNKEIVNWLLKSGNYTTICYLPDEVITDEMISSLEKNLDYIDLSLDVYPKKFLKSKVIMKYIIETRDFNYNRVLDFISENDEYIDLCLNKLKLNSDHYEYLFQHLNHKNRSNPKIVNFFVDRSYINVEFAIGEAQKEALKVIIDDPIKWSIFENGIWRYRDSSYMIPRINKLIKMAIRRGDIEAIKEFVDDPIKWELFIGNILYSNNEFPKMNFKSSELVKTIIMKGDIRAFRALQNFELTIQDIDDLFYYTIKTGQLSPFLLDNAKLLKKFLDNNLYNYSDMFSSVAYLNYIFENGNVGIRSNLAKQKFMNGDIKFLSDMGEEFCHSFLDENQVELVDLYKQLPLNLKKVFTDYVKKELGNISVDKYELIVDILKKIVNSNSTEIRNHAYEFATLILNSDNPSVAFDRIETVFIKNNLPYVGKAYLTFQILHPQDRLSIDFDINNSNSISPILKHYATRPDRLNMIIFSDLLKASMGSNNRSLSAYLKNIEDGNNLFLMLSEGKITIEQIKNNEEAANILNVFCEHLNTLYNNSQIGRKQSNQLTYDLEKDLSEFLKLFKTTDMFDLPDRIIRMYGILSGYGNFEEAKQYRLNKVREADSRNRKYAKKQFVLEQGDFIKGIGGIEFLENILQNGVVAKEFLGDSAGSDYTPLDTDLSRILSSGASINESINSTISNSYGPIWLVLKNNDRFTTTRKSNIENIEIATKIDLRKIEVFHTLNNNEHYGIRTGFASSEIDYIVVDKDDSRVYHQIAMNGFYIPVVDKKTGNLLFSPEDYDKLRSKMTGLKYYEEFQYQFNENLKTGVSEQIIEQIKNNQKETKEKRDAIVKVISKRLEQFGLSVKTQFDGDLSEGNVILVDTGSTGRGTNILGDGDFDFMLLLDAKYFKNPDKLSEIKRILKETLPCKRDEGKFRLKEVGIEGLDEFVDIDITFAQKTNKVDYTTEICLKDRLNTIKEQSEEKYMQVIANILLGKKLLKNYEVYKPFHSKNGQGGLGGVGIENWILQNGGSFEQAARSFIEIADICKTFDEFKSKYKIWDFGRNYYQVENGYYPYDDFIEHNMNEEGFNKMKIILKKYISTLKLQPNNTIFSIEPFNELEQGKIK